MEPLAAFEQGDQETDIDQDRIARRRPDAGACAAVAGLHRAARRLMPLAGRAASACAALASRVAYFASKLRRMAARTPALSAGPTPSAQPISPKASKAR